MNTTLHGLRYVGDRKITLFERLFFGAMFLLVFLFSIYFITNIWIKWSASPMIITLNAHSTPISEFPFPAVTICNMNQAKKSAVDKIPRFTVDYSLVQSLCTLSRYDDSNTTKPGKWHDFKRVLLKVSQPCDQMLIRCDYGGFESECMSLFKSILTDEGLCCIFNGLSEQRLMKDKYSQQQLLTTNGSETVDGDKDWSPEKGYNPDDLKNKKDGVPRQAVGTGNNLGLFLLLDVAEEEYYCSSTNSYGFKVLLHSPNETPKIAYFGTAVANGYETRIIVIPTLSEASYSVRKVPKSVRQCLFESENELIFYRTYSRRNCQMECEARIFLTNCDCVRSRYNLSVLYYMPRFHEDINICGRSDNPCVNRVIRELRTKTNSSFICECLPGCYAIAYETEISLSPLLPQSPLLQGKKLVVSDTAVLNIYFKEPSVRAQRKEELIGFTEFLSNTGGLLGLFMGFSVISVIELFYFMSIRPYCNYLRISESRRRTFRKFFHKIRNRFGRKSDKVSKSIVAKHVNHPVFPYID
ncbi:pickpocket protein 28-like isoform X2 [Contarinia nasturtii]|uniref:pickpocket protein 28-like isoform X2 n=1 Tax=Contarinia nasturtii TaxID=265458 RepID=UPI0012D389D1|nr:pickpocket protein 28-like isoform X2 [Contarinia nasturtii]